MKALSIRQPWAWAILRAGKRIENRSWPTRFRGPVLIHAGVYKPKQQDVDDFNAAFFKAVPSIEDRKRICPQFTEALSLYRGGIVGRAVIVDCVSQSDSPWFFGPYGFVLDQVEPLPFRPFKGALGFFDVPDELTKAA
jgi:hypothetical protein